jgi:hypothetical protein
MLRELVSMVDLALSTEFPSSQLKASYIASHSDLYELDLPCFPTDHS